MWGIGSVRWLGLVAVGLSAGCVNPWNTIFPTFAPRPVIPEKEMAQIHRPFLEDLDSSTRGTTGPNIRIFPPEFLISRPEPQQTLSEQRRLGLPTEPVAGGAPTATSEPKYPQAVRE